MTTTEQPSSTRRFGPRAMLGVAVAAALAAFAVAALLSNIIDRKQEAKNPFFRVVELDARSQDPAEWGKNFPLQYDGYVRTVDMERTRFGGSEALPRVPDGADPRPYWTTSKLEQDPRLVRMWAGYGFSIDYREKRGHAYMLEDQTYTERIKRAKQPGTCLNCHASMVVPWLEAGDGDLVAGFEAVNAMSWEHARELVEHPIACIDCHDPITMELRITRPAFAEAIARVKANQGIENYDVKDATRQEMRSYVCGQCHVEYYFEDQGKRLRYPWDRGLKAEDIADYYDELEFADWTHADSKTPMLKAQHPEFEMWSQGTHAAAGVGCVDCHMPYRRVGALKISDHHVRSPMLDVASACQTCHRVSEDQLRSRVERIQQRTTELESIGLDALMPLIDDIERAEQAGAPASRLELARKHHRRGSFFVDFVLSENSQGFHADQEAARILALALDEIRRGQAALYGEPRVDPLPTAEPSAAPQVTEPPASGLLEK